MYLEEDLGGFSYLTPTLNSEHSVFKDDQL